MKCKGCNVEIDMLGNDIRVFDRFFIHKCGSFNLI